ncbi:MAG: tRNA 2-thiocytidine biosynthesis TtcA family protein [Paludibacteraceae bacterium]|nr:tRNA 2-thiocytidine biosynthesis TtcA family protein [Paludibacteraceae bacterium]
MALKCSPLEFRITRRFHEACKRYELLEDGDKILVALSGGKDSLALTRLMATQARIHKPRIQVEVAHVIMTNIPYETDRTYLQHFCEDLGVPFHLLTTCFDDSETDDIILQRKRKSKCFLCAWNRRKALFEFAVSNGFNKICLGHHQDDFIVTLLMNMSMEGHIESMKPLMQMKHFPLQLIRPLCLTPESEIAALASELNFSKLKTLCPYDHSTMRTELADVFRQIENLSDVARFNLWSCVTQTF